MIIRRTVVATGLCLSLLTAGCASVIAGSPQIDSGGALPTTSNSAPSPFPDPSGGESSTGGTGDSSSPDSSSSTDSSSSSNSTDSSAVTDSTGSTDSSTSTDDTSMTENTPTVATSTGADDSSVGPSSATSIPGLSKDCNTVLAGITAFSKLLQGAGSTDTIGQATVDETLRQLPASGLPTRPQADISVLRATVSGAAGKTLTDLGRTMTDGKVVAALEDLSSWAQDNCS